MSDGLMLSIGDDGIARAYDDTYDITIHCESREEQEEARKALESIPRWIPCSERLPKNDGRYLVTNTRLGAWKVDIDTFFVGSGWKSDDDPVAWMEKPEAWEGEQ